MAVTTTVRHAACSFKVHDQRSADAKTRDGTVNGESPDQQCRDRVWRLLGDGIGRARTIDPGHRKAGVSHDDRFDVRDHPRRRRVSPTVL